MGGKLLGIGKIIATPTGLMIISVISIILTGFNPLILLFDLIIKSINILSGNALIQAAINGVFTPDSPIFIVYITIFVVSFLLLIFKLIKNSLSDIAIGSDFGNAGKEKVQTFSKSKLKWIAVWLISWITLPFAFGILMYVINLFANLFALTPLSINNIFIFTTEDWKTSVASMHQTISTQANIVETFLNTFFPKDISKVELPNWLYNQGVELDTWKTFLGELAKNTDAIAYKESMETLLSKMNVLLETAPIWNVDANRLVQMPLSETQSLINGLINKINDINGFINGNNIPFAKLEVGINTTLNSPIFGNIFTGNAELMNKITSCTLNNANLVKAIPDVIVDAFNKSKLTGIANFGFEGQSIENNEITFRPERLTLSLASSLYQMPIYSYSMNAFARGTANIPVIGIIVSLFDNVSWVLSNPINLIDLIVSTTALAFCFTTFFSITIMFAVRIFDFFSAIITAPMAAISGLNDNGEKFQVWFKTFFGKALIVFIVSLAISIFVIVIDISAGILVKDDIVNGANISNSIILNLLKKFLMLVVAIATCSGMLEFIGWCSQILSFDNKVGKYSNNYTRQTIRGEMGTFKKQFEHSALTTFSKKNIMRAKQAISGGE